MLLLALLRRPTINNMIYPAVVLLLFYPLLILLITFGVWKKQKKLISTDKQGISVVVAARNEEKIIASLLDRLVKQNYPQDKYEVIVVDDNSTDATSEIVKKYPPVKSIKIDSNGLGNKKKALAQGIASAKFPILAFTDADCLPSQNWLSEIDSHFSEGVHFVAGYSPLITQDRFIGALKNLERLAIFAVSAGSINLGYGLTCTARNMAYKKELYQKVEGFNGIEHVKSGDDDLMLHRMNHVQGKKQFMFSRESIIPSYDDKTKSQQIQQETRRASKWKHYNGIVKTISALVFLYYLLLLFLISITIAGKFDIFDLALLFLIKIFMELLLIISFMYRIKDFRLLKHFPAAEIIYIPYFVFFALKGTFGRYSWK